MVAAPTVRRWGVLSAALAPVLLVGGWQLAAARQPGGFDQVRRTISELAGLGATDRWVMTAGLAGLGVCHVLTALALRPAGVTGRLVLALGGVATVVVATAPLPASGSSTTHTVAATVGFLALTAWVVLAFPRSRAAWAGGALLLAALLWFGAELGGSQFGLSERVLSGAQAVAPLLAVLTLLRAGPASRGTRTRRLIAPAPS